LQLCVMMSRLVNGGLAVTPKILLSEEAVDAPATIPYKRRNLEVVLKGMEAVINSPKGVAFAQRIRTKGMSYGGKTGSAQVRRISKKERDVRVRKNEEKPWIERDHALFVGFGPLENPRYAISVIVEHGGGGSTKAAPIAKDVLKFMFDKDKNKPRRKDA